MEQIKKLLSLLLNKKRTMRVMLLIVFNLSLTACSTFPNPYDYNKEVVDKEDLIISPVELQETELLDVSIKVFDPGKLPEDTEEKRGLSTEIRNSEARYMPIHLKYTMQRSGYWGNVRVVPDNNDSSELLIKGKIVHSDGESIELVISAYDARNTLWFEKTYKETVRIDKRQNTEQEKTDNFQNLYNKISNDIIKQRQELTAKDITQIKQVSEMRFAQLMAPDAFANYLVTDKKGQYKIKKLPSVDDPMMKRVQSIKARDELLIDTMNNYYDIYYSDMWDSYDDWRKFRSEELDSLREIERKALAQKVIGAAAIIGAIALGASTNSDVRDRTGALRSVMIAGGGYSLYSGFKTSKETEINKEAIEELGLSFSTEIEPMVVDIDGKTLELTGSAEQQYSKWRNLLKEIYRNETGFE